MTCIYMCKYVYIHLYIHFLWVWLKVSWAFWLRVSLGVHNDDVDGVDDDDVDDDTAADDDDDEKNEQKWRGTCSSSVWANGRHEESHKTLALCSHNAHSRATHRSGGIQYT